MCKVSLRPAAAFALVFATFVDAAKTLLPEDSCHTEAALFGRACVPADARFTITNLASSPLKASTPDYSLEDASNLLDTWQPPEERVWWCSPTTSTPYIRVFTASKWTTFSPPSFYDGDDDKEFARQAGRYYRLLEGYPPPVLAYYVRWQHSSGWPYSSIEEMHFSGEAYVSLANGSVATKSRREAFIPPAVALILEISAVTEKNRLQALLRRLTQLVRLPTSPASMSHLKGIHAARMQPAAVILSDAAECTEFFTRLEKDWRQGRFHNTVWVLKASDKSQGEGITMHTNPLATLLPVFWDPAADDPRNAAEGNFLAMEALGDGLLGFVGTMANEGHDVTKDDRLATLPEDSHLPSLGGACKDKSRFERGLSKDEDYLLQQYLPRGLLPDGRKTEVRVYFLIASLDPMLVFLYTNGTVRLCAEKWEAGDWNNPLKHITNTRQQKRGLEELRAKVTRGDAKPDELRTYEEIADSLKWSPARLEEWLRVSHPEVFPTDNVGWSWWYDQLVPQLKAITATVIDMAKKKIRSETVEANSPIQPTEWGLFGIDLMLSVERKNPDEFPDMATTHYVRPWVTEFQVGPGLALDSAVKIALLEPMLHETVNIILELQQKRRDLYRRSHIDGSESCAAEKQQCGEWAHLIREKFQSPREWQWVLNEAESWNVGATEEGSIRRHLPWLFDQLK